MSRGNRMLVGLVACVTAFLLLAPAFALALSPSPDADVLTIDQTTGGQPTRFTFNALVGPEETITGATFVFPQGSDLSRATVDAVTLDGLSRHNVAVKATPQGETFKLAFDPPIKPKSTLRIVFHDVTTPDKGGTLRVTGTYDVASGGSQPLPALSFQQVPPTLAQKMSYWLDKQPAVAAWNKVQILNGFFKPQLIVQAVPLLFFGWLLSILLVAVAYPVAIPLGLGVAFLKMSKLAPVRWIASAYINVIRGTPLFLQIYIAFFGLPLIGIQLPDIPLGMAVLAFNSAAYLAEIFRAGIQSISKGQFEAASSLGMTYPQAMAYVIIPQTVRRVLPTMTSEFILLFKDTALLSAVGIFELMMNAKNGAANTGNVTFYTVAAVFYLLITIPLINWVQGLEARLALSETGREVPGLKKRRSFLGLGKAPSPAPGVAGGEEA
jgi:His/Glu/Gln/Arg/opine family amino acid ABC transporter permease subunit